MVRLIFSIGLAALLLLLFLGPVGSALLPTIDTRSLTSLNATDEESSVGTGAKSLTKAYKSLLDEIVLFQTDPDYARAESDRQQIAALGGIFDGLSSEIRVKLDVLTDVASASIAEASE